MNLPRSIGSTWVVAAVAAAAPAFVAAQDAKPVELRYATESPQRSLWGTQIERRAKAIEEETNGSVKFQLFFGGALARDQEILRQVASGRIDRGSTTAPSAALLVPELQLLYLPMYFRTQAEIDCVLDNWLTKPVAARLAAKNVQFLGWTEGGTAHVIGKKAYRSPADVSGSKAAYAGFRTGALFWQALGANPTQTARAELAAAFQTGLIDLGVTVPIAYVATGLNKVAPVITTVGMFFAPGLDVMHKPTWDRLTPEQRAGILRAFERMPASQLRREVRDAEARLLDDHSKGGGQIAQISAEQREAFRRVASQQWQRAADEAGPEGRAFFELMETGRRACEKSG